MTTTKTYRVMPKDDGWQVKAIDASRASSRHDKKRDALEAARDFAQKYSRTKVVIHRQDGTVQESRTYN